MPPPFHPQAAQKYLRTRVLTATPEQLQLMLYDGVLRFCDGARAAVERRDCEQVYVNVSRAQKIVTELMSSLKPTVDPALCGNLVAVYKLVYRRLTQVGCDHDLPALDEAIKLLRFQRETWVMLLEQLGKQKAGIAASMLNIPAPDERMEARMSMSA